MLQMQKFANSPQQYLRSVTDHPSAQATEIHDPVGLLRGMLALHYPRGNGSKDNDNEDNDNKDNDNEDRLACCVAC